MADNENERGEYQTSYQRTPTLPHAAGPDMLLMAPLGLAGFSLSLTLFLAIILYAVGTPGGGLWLFLMPAGHFVCVGLASWDRHIVTVLWTGMLAPAPGERVVGVKLGKAPPSRLYPGKGRLRKAKPDNAENPATKDPKKQNDS